ncbi:MAG: LysR family transcriptional regulator [Coriobacteriales bacterium]|jgi:DNA-binding transcriptional LysR family regulator|nr:LysR family transcriptional regulator [Coriobacteriales bacterium]
MQISVIREFVYLSDELNFSATARHFFVSQSVLSKHISSLEREMNIRLFVRDKHSVRLTPLGKLFARRMRKVLEDFDAAVHELEKAKEGINRVLKVGYLHGACRDFITQTCILFKDKHPDCALELYAMEIGEINDAVRRNYVDIGITAVFPTGENRNYHYHRIYRDSLNAVVPVEHRLAKETSVSIDALRKESLLLPSPVTMQEVASFVHHAFQGTGLLNSSLDEAHDVNMMIPSLIMTGGVALAMRHLSSYYGAKFHFLPIENVNLDFHIAALWKRSRDKDVIGDFVASIHKARQQNSAQ